MNVMVLRLRVRSDLDRVEAAVLATADRLPYDFPAPQLIGRELVCPFFPETLDYLHQEFLARRLRTLADRLIDPVRWRGRR